MSLLGLLRVLTSFCIFPIPNSKIHLLGLFFGPTKVYQDLDLSSLQPEKPLESIPFRPLYCMQECTHLGFPRESFKNHRY